MMVPEPVTHSDIRFHRGYNEGVENHDSKVVNNLLNKNLSKNVQMVQMKLEPIKTVCFGH